MGAGGGLFRTKSVEQSIRDTDEPDSKLRKDLTARDLTVFGVAVVIGAGIFTLTAQTAGNMAGPAVSVAFVIAAITCGLTALCYAEFASTVPVAGSAYTYAYATFGELVAWIIGWDLILEFALAVSVVAKGWSQYLGHVLGGTVSPVVHLGSVKFDWGALVIIAIVGVLLATGTKLSSRVSAVAVAIKLSVIVLILVVGATYFKASNLTPFIPAAQPSAKADGVHQSMLAWLTGTGGTSFGWLGLLTAASIAFFAFIGFDVVATAAEETRNPQRDVPRGIFGALAIVTVCYVAVSFVLTGMVPYTQLQGENATLATAFALHGDTWAKNIISIGALAGLSTVVMVMFLGQTRVLFAMSRDGLLPKRLSHTGKHGTPVRLTVIVGVVCAVLAAFVDFGTLAGMVNIGTLVAFILVAIGVPILRRTRPDLKRGFRVPFVPVVPILAALSCLWLMLNLEVETWLRFLIWMAIGVVLYFVYGRSHSMMGRPRPEAHKHLNVTQIAA
ncbi:MULTISPECIES: amino acid permease [Mycobacteriaceae]|jgi:APA family basic amino acid/polyamine antiporter|uniref:Amino acid permease n=2 Tax=Mycolicibacterium TaxID=1866885 RepID=A0A1A0MND8_MYCMU|nr:MULTISPECIES: amino acid permease [Mycolicibacterium]TXH28334.1 MAG: amino acid permease [Mycobacterium sp.]MCX8558476.1 amino acid permease [Mycolicibacterium mucogenicum]OBA87009.1 amino acid permease [Mycolicibacterium mucogenicum]TDK87182.1 amino acid permease [Mycolicibacterium mucogenicum]TLH68005.1 amino acid permease [Mycolicibacterium phocaicum]